VVRHSDRLISVTVQAKQVINIVIVQIHMLTSANIEEEMDDMYEVIEEMLAK